jgi:5,5'-dehydrodivanillate O-demethylase oxygenase subunit
MAATAPPVPQAAADWRDFAHTGPGTLAGRYLRRFWQPVLRGEDLPAGQAKPVRLLGEDFTLYRGEGGTPHLVAYRCAHRGTQLSTGWVEGDCIRCFYHGWKYDATGQCVEMPAEDSSFPSKVWIASYPTEERLGLIFAYLGEGEPPPLPRYPDFERMRLLDVATYTWPSNYFQNIENGPDEVHVSFVHRESSLAPIAGLPIIWAEETDFGLMQYGRRSNGVVRETLFLMPNILYFTTHRNDPAMPEVRWIHTLAWRVPVDDTSHRSFLVRVADVSEQGAAQYFARLAEVAAHLATMPSSAEIGEAVLRGELRMQDLTGRPDMITIQDYVSQVGQGAIADRERERLGRSDVGVILLRKIWERELRALAEGRPLKEWRVPDGLVATTGV